MSKLLLIPSIGSWLAVIYVFVGSGPRRKDVAWFARQHRVELTSANGGHVVDYLRRTRRWRILGAIGSLSFGSAYYVIFGSPSSQFNLYVVLFGGWFAGGILAELPVGRRRVAGTRSAVLVERRPSEFVSLLAKRLLAIAIGTTVLTIGLRVTSQTLTSGPTSTERLSNDVVSQLISTQAVVGLLVLSAAIAAAAGLGMHSVVFRPQTTMPPDLLAADTAVRTAAVTRIAAGWIVLQFIIAGTILAGTSNSEPLNWFSAFLVVVVLVGVLLGWAFVPTRILAPPQRAVVDATAA
jgi:hypothetical protein